MADEKKIDTGGGAHVEGGVHIRHGDFVGRDKITTTGMRADEAAALFERIYAAIDARTTASATDRADLKADVKDVQAEAAKGEAADETALARRLRSVRRMAPDIWQVMLATFANPVAGAGLVVAKVLAKVKDEAETSTPPGG